MTSKNQLLTESIKAKLPKLYQQEEAPDPIVHAKLFLDNWTWFITEGSPTEDNTDYRLFGLVFGFEEEFGYVMLSELEGVKNKYGLGVERDRFFKPKPLSEAKNEYLKSRGYEIGDDPGVELKWNRGTTGHLRATIDKKKKPKKDEE